MSTPTQPNRAHPLALLLLLTSWCLTPHATAAGPPRCLPEGERPEDRRLDKPVTLNDHFPFTPPADVQAWNDRATQLRRQVLVATGLWPMPSKCDSNAVVHGRIDRPEYSVEKVMLESLPGHFVTGNLYRPKSTVGSSARHPGVLCPHGHWPGGRMYVADDKKFAKQLETGAEQFDPSGRYPLQARCAQLARMGCVVFHYDMVGYGDSRQLAHRPGRREAMDTPQDWGFFSTQAELRLQTVTGLQTLNSIRALDWLASLPDVDPERIGVTGASGGGTQTFLLAAVDPRPVVAVPAVMVSTSMQGGCPCENACYLRVGTGNVELAGLFAPRPLGLLAADDWTAKMATDGFPQLQQLFGLLDAEENVALWPFTQFPHNYNHVSRSAMYPWMNRHLGLGLPEPIVERDFQPLSPEELTVFDADHPAPSGGDEHERAVIDWLTTDATNQIAAILPRDSASLAEYRRIVGGAFEAILGRTLPPPGSVLRKEVAELARVQKVAELARVRKVAELARVQKVAELARVQKVAELARVQKVAELARVQKVAELARVRKVAELARVQTDPVESLNSCESSYDLNSCESSYDLNSCESSYLLNHVEAGEQIPCVEITPTKWDGHRLVLWIDENGKAGLWREDGSLREEVGQLLEAGVAVWGIDLFGQGECTLDGRSLEQQPINRSGRDTWVEYAGYTYGYNHSMFARRVHDILSAVRCAGDLPDIDRVDAIGLDGAGRWLLAARAMAPGAIDLAVVDTAGFRFDGVDSINDADFLPGAAKYLGLAGLAALSAGEPLWLVGMPEGRRAPITAAYAAAGTPEALVLEDGTSSGRSAVQWLVEDR